MASRHEENYYHKLLTEGLVGDKFHIYMNNPTFRHTINNLVSLLPLWVDSIAKKSIENEEHQEKLAKLISSNNLDHLMPPKNLDGLNLADQPGDSDDK